MLLSAAIPWQSGERHLNNQWPAWWAAYFRRHGDQPIDCIRRAVWNDPHVEWWYAQNAVIYARPGAVTVIPDLARDCLAPGEAPLALVHPRCYLNEIRPWQRRVMDRLLRLPLRIASPRLRHRARLLAGRMLSPRAS